MRRYFLLFMIILAGIYTNAQEGSVEVIADERIDLLIDKHRYLNRHQSTLEGWRIQFSLIPAPTPNAVQRKPRDVSRIDMLQQKHISPLKNPTTG